MSGPLPKYLSPLTAPAAWVYEKIIATRNARFDKGIGVESVGRPVISIGNITTGGTGKTPMVAWIAEQLIAEGFRPVIAMRGYKAHAGVSDEQAEYSIRLPGTPVVANPDRINALRKSLPEHPEIDCVLLDDGFQHRQLHRDLDLVLIDASANTFNDRLLPAGHLREPLQNLRRADGVILTHAGYEGESFELPSSNECPISNLKSNISNLQSPISNLQSQIEKYHDKPPLACSRHIWIQLDVYEGPDAMRPRDIQWLQGKRVLTMLGIGKPQSVFQQLNSLHAIVVGDIPAKDHQQFDRKDLAWGRLESLAKIETKRQSHSLSGCDAMIVTMKDWVKLQSLIDWSAWPVPVVVPRLQLEVFQGAQQLRNLVLSRICSSKAGEPAR